LFPCWLQDRPVWHFWAVDQTGPSLPLPQDWYVLEVTHLDCPKEQESEEDVDPDDPVAVGVATGAGVAAAAVVEGAAGTGTGTGVGTGAGVTAGEDGEEIGVFGEGTTQ